MSSQSLSSRQYPKNAESLDGDMDSDLYDEDLQDHADQEILDTSHGDIYLCCFDDCMVTIKDIQAMSEAEDLPKSGR
jgi:hypothetical protein